MQVERRLCCSKIVCYSREFSLTAVQETHMEISEMPLGAVYCSGSCGLPRGLGESLEMVVKKDHRDNSLVSD